MSHSNSTDWGLSRWPGSDEWAAETYLAAAGRRQVSVTCEATHAEVGGARNATASIDGFIAPGPSVRSACRITGLALDRFSMNVNLNHDRAHPDSRGALLPSGNCERFPTAGVASGTAFVSGAAPAGLVHVLAVPRRLLRKAMRRPADAHWPDQLA